MRAHILTTAALLGLGPILALQETCRAGPIYVEADRFTAPGDVPGGLAYDGTHYFMSNSRGFRTIFRFERGGRVVDSFLAPSPDGVFNGRAAPQALGFAGSHLFVGDLSGMITEIDGAGTTIFRQFRTPVVRPEGSRLPRYARPGGIAFDGTLLFVSDWDSRSIYVLEPDGTFVREVRAPTRSSGLAVRDGHLFSLSQFTPEIYEYTTDGTPVNSFEAPFRPSGLSGFTFAGRHLAIAETTDPDRFNPPIVPGTIIELTAVPEPSGLALLGLGVLGLAGYRWRRGLSPGRAASREPTASPC